VITVAALERSHLPVVQGLLRDACIFDRADLVAEEKLFAPDPQGDSSPLGGWLGGELVGVASSGGSRIRLIAVHPRARRQGVGSALLAHLEQQVRGRGSTRIRTLDQPGNYLAPGIDERNLDSIQWLNKRGYSPIGTSCNLIVDVAANSRVTSAAYSRCASKLVAAGYEIRRARANESALLDAIGAEFGGAWPFEVAAALDNAPVAVHVVTRAGDYAAFAAHDGNNRGLGWFGPAGTWPAHRGKGLGEVVLLACLLDVAQVHSQCEIAWIGPRGFYERTVGVAAERAFVVLGKDL
jgi:GNAT superfamily N-acetyltransferase